MPLIRIFLLPAAIMGLAHAGEPAPADKFSPGRGYSRERIQPVMPRPLSTRAPAAPPHTLRGAEDYHITSRRAEEAEVPFGCRLLSQGCKVTSSDLKPHGELELITDGDRSGEDGYDVELATGRQWVQLDLGASLELHCVWVWRYHRMPVVFLKTKIEVAESADGPWTSVYNTRADECCGSPDPMYEELYTGFPLILHRPVSARFVRLWSEGSDKFPENHYIEVSVYGRDRSSIPADYFRPLGVGKVKLEPEFPRLLYTAAPSPPPGWKEVENPAITWKRKDNVVISEGCRLLSHRCPVTVSDPAPLGDPACVTDGVRSSEDGNMIDMAPGKQWVQIDLGVSCEVHCLWLWLCHKQPWVSCRNVIVQVSDDAVYSSNGRGTIVLNADRDGSEGMGKGTDMDWEETINGRPVTFPPARGRYIRVWTNGRTLDDCNIFTEVAVYGKDLPEVQKKK